MLTSAWRGPLNARISSKSVETLMDRTNVSAKKDYTGLTTNAKVRLVKRLVPFISA